MKSNKEGYIKVPGGKVWYKIVGNKSSHAPLVVLHGGPGYPHNYLTPLENLSNERQVIFYDQLGCGKSERPTDTKLWTVERFVIELTEILKFLKLNQYHVLGQSWGAALGACFALQKPKGLISLILADPYLSTPIWMKDAKKLIKLLPKRTQKIIAKYIKDGIKTEEYKKARLDFYQRFERMYKTTPPVIVESNLGMNHDIYEYMWGSEEFLITGTLKDFDLTLRLSEIIVPILLVSGRFDEATPEALKYFASLLVNAGVTIFEKSAHYPHLTEKDKYMKILRAFLQKTDQ
ncbi:MAG: proline iminopeptidase-family hydrolase [bacterium]|nr:proline iminopeptidase-family hydrolase [bacterium]